VSETKKPADVGERGPDRMRQLLVRAQAGDEATLPELKKLIEADAFTEMVGNLAAQYETTLIGNAAGKNLIFKEATARKLKVMREELAGEKASALERLLVERIVLCWLSLYDVEIRFAQMKDLTIPQATYWQERIDRAHRRYLTAIKALATVRKLALPALQVNIAKKQVNFGGT
jgi:hypothetical protein